MLLTIQAREKAITSDSTVYFTFHNHLWMNLHHYLYEQASGRQKAHLAEDSVSFLPIPLALPLDSMTAKDRHIMETGIQYYRNELIDQPLLLSRQRLNWLKVQDEYAAISDTSYSGSWTDILNLTREVYQRLLWPAHRRHNAQLLDTWLPTIRKVETRVIERLESLSGSHWDRPVRIDLTTCGNWASAYSPDDDHIVISTIDPLMHSTLFLEFAFHESSHLLFQRSSPFRKALFQAARDQNIPYPKTLWHAAMFYLTGLATRDVLNQLSIEHNLIMEKKKVFQSYYEQDAFRHVLEQYYYGRWNLTRTANQLVTTK